MQAMPVSLVLNTNNETSDDLSKPKGLALKIYLRQSADKKQIWDFLTFNRVPYTTIDTWNSETKTHRVPFGAITNQGKSCLIVSGPEFIDAVDPECLVDFLQENHVIIVQDCDAMLSLTTPEFLDLLRKLNQAWVPKHHLHFVVDGQPDKDFQQELSLLHKFNFVVWPYWYFFYQPPRIHGVEIDKIAPCRDFLLTMRKKPRLGEHRDILWQEIQSRPKLANRGHAFYKSQEEIWIGDTPQHHDWRCGHPSMDLYRDSWMEIVPETRYQHGHFLSEKIFKPMATKTPFFVVSTQGYLAHLRQLGFRTFDGILDESYDDMPRVEDRISLMLDQVESMIDLGPAEFYNRAGPVLEHNHRYFAEIRGQFQNIYDRLMHDLFCKIDQKFHLLYNNKN